jgi:hypothetical protein
VPAVAVTPKVQAVRAGFSASTGTHGRPRPRPGADLSTVHSGWGPGHKSGRPLVLHGCRNRGRARTQKPQPHVNPAHLLVKGDTPLMWRARKKHHNPLPGVSRAPENNCIKSSSLGALEEVAARQLDGTQTQHTRCHTAQTRHTQPGPLSRFSVLADHSQRRPRHVTPSINHLRAKAR